MSAKRAAGLVIFRNVNQAVQFLMLQTSYGEHHWTPPKGKWKVTVKVIQIPELVFVIRYKHVPGHVDPGESDWITALRETKEEAGLSEEHLEIYKDVSKTLNYNVNGKPKVVVYWLAKLRDPETKVQLSDEHQNLKWLPLKEAQEISGYEDMKQLLTDFNEKAKLLL
ncbi:hypothetical protein B5X24_HaOG208565 [Helicoverpa armigera]|nr:hypothetical protein B5X24_HaOG208565 [Helicoverpa armigera]